MFLKREGKKKGEKKKEGKKAASWSYALKLFIAVSVIAENFAYKFNWNQFLIEGLLIMGLNLGFVPLVFELCGFL